MKFAVIFLIISTNWISISQCTGNEPSSCDIQKLCRVTCSELDFSHPPSTYKLESMTDGYREVILNKMNEFRNDVARGLKYKDVMPASANMRQMVWNKEFEYYAELFVVNNRECDDYSGQAKGWQSYYYNVPEFGFGLRKAIDAIITMTIKPNTWSMSLSYVANNTQIGCAFGTHADIRNVTSILLRCNTGMKSVSNIQGAYEIGEPCTKCDMWSTVCSAKWPGLCA